MELREAIDRELPLQVRLPNPKQPLSTQVRCAAEVFLVETTHGSAVVWMDTFWPEAPPAQAIHIAYARPASDPAGRRWVDEYPRYGPRSLVCQKPFVIERMGSDSPQWPDFLAWRERVEQAPGKCGRGPAWECIRRSLADLLLNGAT